MSEVRVLTAERGKRGVSEDGQWIEYETGEAMLGIEPPLVIGDHLVDRVTVHLHVDRDVAWKVEFSLKGWPRKANGEVDARAIRKNISESWLAIGKAEEFSGLFPDGLTIFGDQWFTREDVMVRITHLSDYMEGKAQL